VWPFDASGQHAPAEDVWTSTRSRPTEDDDPTTADIISGFRRELLAAAAADVRGST
jgi:hypothetical protein